jgi:hypothetical protein
VVARRSRVGASKPALPTFRRTTAASAGSKPVIDKVLVGVRRGLSDQAAVVLPRLRSGAPAVEAEPSLTIRSSSCAAARWTAFSVSGFGATASFIVEVPHPREGSVPGKQLSFGEAVADAIANRWSGRESAGFGPCGGERAAQLKR